MDSYLESLQQAIASATRDITAEELRRHPEGKWCAAEVLEHLFLTYTGTVKGCERCLQAGEPLGSRPTLKQRCSTLAVTGFGYFPRGRQSPERARPKGMEPEKVLAEIGPQIARMDELIAQCESQYGSRIKMMDHPVLGPLTARQWRKFHWLHGRHHVKQIFRLRRTT
jgi:Protein of unknown function (DUF1569)